MRERGLVGGAVVAATKKKKKKKRHLEPGRYKQRSPCWLRTRVRAGVLQRGADNRRLDVDQKEEEEEEEEEAEEGSRNFGVYSEISTDLGAREEEEEETRGGGRKSIGLDRIQRIHRRRRDDRPTTSWTGRPREFSL